MAEWKARRFWKTADIRPQGEGWEVVLDGRPLRTPGKLPLILPTEALARAIAAEWDAQTDVIDPNRMPLTRADVQTLHGMLRQLLRRRDP